MGSKWIEMSNHGFGLTVYWDAPYGSTSAYMWWEVDYNDYGRTFNLYNYDTKVRYNSGSTIPLGTYRLYVYKNGSYATDSGNFTIAADAPPTYTVSYNNGGRGTAPSSQSATSGSSITLRGKMSDVAGTSYTVSYNANGGSSTPSSSTSTQTYTHTKWAKGSTSGTQYDPSSSYTVTGNTTMYGIWSGSRAAVTLPAAITMGDSYYYYNIYYDVNGGDSTTPANHALTRKHTNTFAGWNTAQNGSGTTYAAQTSFTPSSNTTLYAKWTAGSLTGSTTLAAAATKNDTTQTGYTITFNANGGSCSTANLTATDTVKWTFNKWNTEADGTGMAYSAGASYSTDAHVTLYATWTSSVTKGSINLPTPTRTGYSFQGWATSSGATSGSTGSYTPNATRTLYATWKANTYPISYDANGGTGAPSSQTKTHDVALTLSSTKPTKASTSSSTTTNFTITGNANGGYFGTTTVTTTSITAKKTTPVTTSYTFSKWNTKANGSGTSYNAGASYTENNSNTLYAQWTSSSTNGTSSYTNNAISALTKPTRANTTVYNYKVTYNANGGTCSTASAQATKIRSYSFGGWATTSTATSANAATSYTSAKTLYAYWTPSDSGGSVSLPTPTRTGYTFKGWSTSQSATSGVTGTYTPTAATTLYATWQINTWTVTYNANGYGTAPVNQTKTHGSNLTLQPFIADQSGPGYTVSFNKNNGDSTPGNLTSTVTKKQTNWNTKSNGTGTNYGSKGTYSSDASTTLYAIWSTINGSITLPAAITRKTTNEDGYKVTLNANGGVCSETELDQVIITSYTFDKWAQGSTSGTKYAAGASFTPTAATTMYATWTEKVGRSSVDLPTPAREGYTFTGWGTSASATSGVTGEYLPTSNITLYAIWKKNGSLIHYNNNGVDTLCEVYYNNNGNAVLCNVYYNNNGIEVKI